MKVKIIHFATSLLLPIALALPINSVAQDGSLDLSFDTDGIVTTAIGIGNDEYQYAMAVQSDGKIVVAGYSQDGGGSDFALVRYNTNGSLDLSFDTDGKVTTAIGVNYDVATSIAIQSDGKIVVAGFSLTASNRDFALVRYNTDGSLDLSFDNDGIVTTAIGAMDDKAYAIAIQSDGKIVVAGNVDIGSNLDFALVRYNTNGSLDLTFDNDGMVTTAIGATYDVVTSVAIQSDGKIVVAGYTDAGPNYWDIALVRYNSNGSLDLSFDADGIVTTAIGTVDERAHSVAIQSDGKIVVAGYTNVVGNLYDFALVRYNTNGSLDLSFDTDGMVTTAIGTSSEKANSIVIQSDGKILVAGVSNNGTNDDIALVRYNTNGSLDLSFDTDGMLTTAIGTGNEMANSIALQNDGKIVVAGYSNNGFNEQFAVVRYNNPSLTAGVGEFSEIANQISVYPNPFSIATTFQTETVLNNATLAVYNTLGKQVKEIKNITGRSIILKRDNLPSGVYFITLTEDNVTLATKKLIVAE